VTFGTAGPTDVSLEMTSLGCEAKPQTITKSVMVNSAATGIKYPDITVPQGSTQFIHARDLAGDSYTWKPSTNLTSYNSRYTEFIANGNDVQYLINIADKHSCITTDTLLVQVLKKPGYYLPTAFSPNGDGLNDLLTPYLIGMKSLKRFSIYNRWGHLVFYSTKYGEGWNGKFQGRDQDAGVYIWMLEFIDSNDKKVSEKGTVTIIR
jgi:gliding motility-associated-like protein